VVSIKALCFTDPLSFQAAISTADLQLLPTARGQYRAELTKVCFDQLWMQCFYQNLPVDQRGRNEAGTQSIYFPHVSGTGSDATLRHGRFVNKRDGAVGNHEGMCWYVKLLCAGIQPGDGRIKACIKSHFSDVSAPCQAVLVKAAAISKACSADVKKVCADVKPGGGRIEACMKTHLSEVSDPCKDAVTQAAAGKI
jgi:hypothetical protein